MKKMLRCMLTLILIVASVFFIAGCKGPQYDSMEAFLEGEEMQSSIAADKSALEGSGMSLEVTSQGNQLIYTYTYAEALEVESSKQILKQGIEAEQDAFQKILENVKAEVNIENPVLVIRYLNPDGSEIYSHTFTVE